MFRLIFSHLQVLNMLQVSGRCAHIWDPYSVYIKTKPFISVGG